MQSSMSCNKLHFIIASHTSAVILVKKILKVEQNYHNSMKVFNVLYHVLHFGRKLPNNGCCKVQTITHHSRDV